MYNTSNPAELYTGTTWELLPADKYLKTGNTPLQQGGSNSFTISKANLPAIKIQLESFQLGKGTQEITGEFRGADFEDYNEFHNYDGYSRGAFYEINHTTNGKGYGDPWTKNSELVGFKASRSWTGMSTPANPYTQNLGNGTALNIQPLYITLKFWKRLT